MDDATQQFAARYEKGWPEGYTVIQVGPATQADIFKDIQGRLEANRRPPKMGKKLVSLTVKSLVGKEGMGIEFERDCDRADFTQAVICLKAAVDDMLKSLAGDMRFED